MTKTFGFAVACLLGLAVLGCDSKKSDSNNSETGSTLKSVSTDNSAANTATNSSSDKQKAPAVDPGKIPASLKGDAYEYYGLSRTEPAKMKVVKDGNDMGEGTQTTTLSKVGSDFAEFSVSSSGSLAALGLGEAVVRLDKSGIKIVTLNGKSPGGDNYELPSEVKVGKTWPFKLTNDQIKMSGSSKISGTETVKTPVGTYKDALVILESATGTEGGQPVKFSSKTWLVKGRGQVKTEIINVSGKEKHTFSMQESK